MTRLYKDLGPRPHLKLIVYDGRILQIWAGLRAPAITLHDYSPQHTCLRTYRDTEGLSFTKIKWTRPAWALGLCLSSPLI